MNSEDYSVSGIQNRRKHFPVKQPVRRLTRFHCYTVQIKEVTVFVCFFSNFVRDH